MSGIYYGTHIALARIVHPNVWLKMFISDATSMVRTELKTHKFGRKIMYHGRTCMHTEQGVVK